MAWFRFGRDRAVDVADHILLLAQRGGMRLDPLQLNKLCYITQGFCLAESGNPAFKDVIEAWMYGPVVKSVYRRFRQYGRMQITHLSDGKTALNRVKYLPGPEEHAGSARLPNHTARAAGRVVSTYGKYSGIELLKMAHYEDTPWHKVYSPCSNNTIPTKLILEHYRDLADTAPRAGL